ncbi:MAG: sigma-70 family RNA polymerase sigma factor [Spirochaetes bacterium]|nr:sigma-70 family RNA polymerase sigma factor [Spirochaetota bacterium]
MTENRIIREIYNLYHKELFIYIYRFIRAQETSEDILQDTFYNLIKYSENHNIDKSRARAFLYRTAHNLCINYKKRQTSISFSALDETSNISASDNILDNLQSRELEKKIYELLNETDPVSRSIFIMKKELDMTIDEIADNTGKSHRTVRRKLQKTLTYLYENLRKNGIILLLIILKLSFLDKLIV